MRFLRRPGIFLYRFFECFLLLVTTWLLMAFALPQVRFNSDYAPAEDGVPVFIRSNGVHTDFVVPVYSRSIHWDTMFSREAFGADSSFGFVAFGWGDKGFFLNTPTWDDLTFSTAFTAACGIGESAVHVDYLEFMPKESARVIGFTISDAQYLRLINYIKSTLQLENENPILINHTGYGKHDLFFEANGRYSLFTTCNEWTGDGMEEAGLPVGIWTPLEFGIMR